MGSFLDKMQCFQEQPNLDDNLHRLTSIVVVSYENYTEIHNVYNLEDGTTEIIKHINV